MLYNEIQQGYSLGGHMAGYGGNYRDDNQPKYQMQTDVTQVLLLLTTDMYL